MCVEINYFSRKTMWALINLDLKNIELLHRHARAPLKTFGVSFNLFRKQIFKKTKTPTMIYPSITEFYPEHTDHGHSLKSSLEFSQVGQSMSPWGRRRKRNIHRLPQTSESFKTQRKRPYVHFLRLPQKCRSCGRRGLRPPGRCRLPR